MADPELVEEAPPRVIEGTLVVGARTQNYRPRFDEVKKTYYVRLLRQGFRRYRAAEMVNTTYETVSRHLRSDSQFAAAVLEAESIRLDEVEEVLYETAMSGNVTALQIVLYNKRPEVWADQRMLKARLDAAQIAADKAVETAPSHAVDGLRTKLLELRERLTEPVETTVTADAVPDPEVEDQ